ncbi:MAG TPA: methyltransferase domain-containing protein [Thermomonospora sp.]|nr:methyltransferase domain-containing protein [Thermomonospora sp.]
MTAARLVARCVHGLEATVAAEILDRGLGSVTRLGHREVHFRTSHTDPRVLTAATVDDVFLLAAQGPDIGPAASGLSVLRDLVHAADIGALLRLRERCGGPGPLTGVEVSASFLGRRSFNRYDAEDTVGLALARRLGTDYHSRRDGVAPPPHYGGWRLTLNGTHATLMLRVAARPLHRRPYKRRSIAGTLHPPVAAAMVRTAEIQPGHSVLDPCCGAGTLLLEAAGQEPEARLRGYDLSQEAVKAARENATGLPVTLGQADAGDLPVEDASVDRVLSNPPWGGQVSAGGLLAGSRSRWWKELRRVLTPGGIAVLLVADPGDITEGIRTGLTPSYVQRVRISGAESFIVRFTVPRRPRHRRA